MKARLQMWQSVRELDEMAYLTATEGHFSDAELARRTDITRSTAWRHIKELMKWGRVEWIGKGQYRLNENDIMMHVLVSMYRQEDPR
jgi:DNA-binding IclR family transcriptional regulator